MKIENVKVDDLRFKAKNPNHMDPEDYVSLVRLLKKEGHLLQPILVDEKMEIIDGEHRARAATEAGFDEVPAVVVPSDRKQTIVRALSMNRLRGREITDIVGALMRELDMTVPEIAFDTGYSTVEVQGILAGTAEKKKEVSFQVNEGLRTFKFQVDESAAPKVKECLAFMEKTEGITPKQQLEALCVEYMQSHREPEPDA